MSNTNGNSSTIEASYLQNDIAETAGGESPMPIALIGLSCKFAGDATSSHKLWQLCAQGKSAWSTIPADIFNQEAFYHPAGEKQTISNIAGGYFFKDDVSLFDASFFNMSSDVADTMDPQCRLQLESVYEALESAGIPIKKIAGTSTAVFAGLFFRDYQDSFMRDPEAYPRQVVTGNGATMMSNRISHFSNLHGPSMTVDTACSTALVALHMACQSLRSGESKMAI